MLKMKTRYYGEGNMDYYGFTVEPGFCYGTNTETNNPIVYTAETNTDNDKIAIFEFIDGNWEKLWYNINDITNRDILEIEYPEFSKNSPINILSNLASSVTE